MSAIPGRTSKVKRYYWREIEFAAYRLLSQWEDDLGYVISDTESMKKFQAFEKEALIEIKALHLSNPKYTYSDETQAGLIKRCDVEVVDYRGIHVKRDDERKVLIESDDGLLSAEEFVRFQFQKDGYQVLDIESKPFHVLFGIFLYQLIQDPQDEKCRVVEFGRNSENDDLDAAIPVRTMLPEDFGTPGYARRRDSEIKEFFKLFPFGFDDLKNLFDQLLDPSTELRSYLWANSNEDVQTARKLLDILQAETVIEIIRFLVDDYWRRYLGWPDLIVYRDTDYFFVEVKSSRDRLSEDQKSWIESNYNSLKLPFKLAKIHNRSN